MRHEFGPILMMLGIGAWVCYAVGVEDDPEREGLSRADWAGFALIGAFAVFDGVMTLAGWW